MGTLFIGTRLEKSTDSSSHLGTQILRKTQLCETERCPRATAYGPRRAGPDGGVPRYHTRFWGVGRVQVRPLFLYLPLSTQTPTRSFLLRKSTSLYNRRQSKIVSTLTSLFSSSYVFHWSLYFPDTPLVYPPSFDGRIVLYPGTKQVKDYFAWRQADSMFCFMFSS